MQIGDKVWTVIEYMTNSPTRHFLYSLVKCQVVSYEPDLSMVCVLDGSKLMFLSGN